MVLFQSLSTIVLNDKNFEVTSAIVLLQNLIAYNYFINAVTNYGVTPTRNHVYLSSQTAYIINTTK